MDRTAQDVGFLGPESGFTGLVSTAVTRIELLERHYYWRWSWLRRWYKKQKRSRRRDSTGGVSWAELLSQLTAFLSVIPYRGDPLLLVHSSMDGLTEGLSEAEFEAAGGDEIVLARSVLAALTNLMGAEGTLCMPTHPFYPYAKWGLGLADDKCSVVPRFDPNRTPSSVGLLTDLFRRSPGVQRSEFPLSTMAVRGPLAGALLHDNVCEDGLLPHGMHSSWSHVCERKGVVVGIGLPLSHYLTVIHCNEETADQEWPIRDFFYPRQFMVKRGGADIPVTVREHHRWTASFISEQRYRRDLLREGVLHESQVCGVPVSWAYSDDVLAVMRYYGTLCPGYPYFVPRGMKTEGHHDR